MEREIINLEINYDINKLNRLIRGSLNTVIFDRPQTKNRILEKIINTVNNNGLVFYIDLETKFRVNLEQEIIRLKKPENLIVFSIIKNNLDNIIESNQINVLFLYYKYHIVTSQANRIIFQNKIIIIF